MAYTTIDKSDDYFNTLIYTGNGTSGRSVTGVGFQPDWVWIKNRDDGDPHKIFDVVRGASKSIKSNSADQEVTNEENGYVSAFNSDGFTLTAGSTSQQDVNNSGENYVSWNWLAANGTSSNTDGSITSTVSANTTAGFSIVKFTGTGSAATVGHGLGVAPDWYVVKRYNGGDGGQWNAYHSSLGATKYLLLNGTNASQTSGTRWNNTEPTSSVFTVNTSGDVNNSGDLHVAYCFAEKKGFSKFGSYEGNGSDNGAFVYTGFKPAWLLIKRTDSGENWMQVDNKRNPFNDADSFINPNNSSAESDNNVVLGIDLLSNGFKCNDSDAAINNGDYIYLAFAENPFVTSTGIPGTAR